MVEVDRMTTKEYLQKYTIKQVGTPGSVREICVDAIVDSPEKLIEFAVAEGLFVSQILWWHRIPMGDSSPIGLFGGPLDPRDSQYYFLETYVCDTFDEDTATEEYLTYLEKVKEKYKDYDLYPSFTIKVK